jgi:sugar fermentation stimulation protein A
VSLGEELVRGEFQGRYRRFLVKARINGEEWQAFLPNTARLRGLLTPGRILLLRKTSRSRTKYDVVAAYDGNTPVVVDSRIPNAIVREALLDHRILHFSQYHEFRQEVKVQDSRLDFVLLNSEPYFLEVKGCTMSEDSFCLYPDAPTERGRKHLSLLTRMRLKGNHVGIVFIAMRPDVRAFKVNKEIDALFAERLTVAKAVGVDVLAYSMTISSDSVCSIGDPLSIVLN